jgi:hypothetical protein
MTNTRLDQCPWCEKQVVPEGTGAKEPVLDGLRWWHQGCVADASRAAQEIPQGQAR